jgi:hypothetical protein
MHSLPTIEKDPYIIERSANDQKIAEIFSQLFPDTPVPYEFIFDIIRLLESTKVNARLLPEVIRGVYNLRTSTRRGQVIIHVNSELTNVQIRENSEAIPTLMDDEIK